MAGDDKKRIREIEERIGERMDQRNSDTSAALVKLRDDYIRGALDDQAAWPGRDSRSFKTAAHFDALFVEMFDSLLRRPPVGLSAADWTSMLEDYQRSR